MRTRSTPILAGATLSVLLALTAATSATLATDEVVVASGDTLSAIALEHGLTVDQLVAFNQLPDPNRIYAGQRLKVEAPAVAAPAAAAPAAPAAAEPRTHVVAAGEHLTGIARRYGTTIATLVAMNGISNPSFIRAGTRLTVPGAAAAPAAAAPATPAPGVSMPASMSALVASRADVGAVIVEMAQLHGVPVAFAKAVAWQESGWQQGVTSHAGAIGVMQLMSATADWVGAAMLHDAPSPHDLRWNVSAGVRLLRHYLDRYGGDRSLVLAAYYQGQRAVDRHGIFAVSRPYIGSILVLERLFGG